MEEDVVVVGGGVAGGGVAAGVEDVGGGVKPQLRWVGTRCRSLTKDHVEGKCAKKSTVRGKSSEERQKTNKTKEV